MGTSPQPLLATRTIPTIPSSVGDEAFGARSSMGSAVQPCRNQGWHARMQAFSLPTF